MHSHDRTLIASLGFADPDKREALHHLACRYLALPENHRRLVGLIDIPARFRDKIESLTAEPAYPVYSVFAPGDGAAAFERPISKGEGKYKTTIGFADLVLPFYANYPGKDPTSQLARLVVEVKIAPIGADAILRQLNLYREYLDSSVSTRLFAATAWRLSAGESAVLLGAGIQPIQLSQAFREWAASQEAHSSADRIATMEI